jgi:hypothetical protein
MLCIGRDYGSALLVDAFSSWLRRGCLWLHGVDASHCDDLTVSQVVYPLQVVIDGFLIALDYDGAWTLRVDGLVRCLTVV